MKFKVLLTALLVNIASIQVTAMTFEGSGEEYNCWSYNNLSQSIPFASIVRFLNCIYNLQTLHDSWLLYNIDTYWYLTYIIH